MDNDNMTTQGAVVQEAQPQVDNRGFDELSDEEQQEVLRASFFGEIEDEPEDDGGIEGEKTRKTRTAPPRTAVTELMAKGDSRKGRPKAKKRRVKIPQRLHRKAKPAANTRPRNSFFLRRTR